MRVFNQAFYATQDTLTPAYIAIFGLVVHVIMAPFWMAKLGVVGLCLSTALTTFINLCVCFVLVNIRIGRIFARRMLKHFLQCLFASGIMGVFLYGYTQLEVNAHNFIANFALLITVCFMGACIYFMTAQILGIKEVYIFRKIFGKRRRQRRPKNVTQPIV